MSMDVTPKRNAKYTKFWYHIAAHTVPFSFRFENNSQYFAHAPINWKTQVHHFSLLCQEETPESMMNSLFQLTSVFAVDRQT